MSNLTIKVNFLDFEEGSSEEGTLKFGLINIFFSCFYLCIYLFSFLTDTKLQWLNSWFSCWNVINDKFYCGSII